MNNSPLFYSSHCVTLSEHITAKWNKESSSEHTQCLTRDIVYQKHTTRNMGTPPGISRDPRLVLLKPCANLVHTYQLREVVSN